MDDQKKEHVRQALDALADVQDQMGFAGIHTGPMVTRVNDLEGALVGLLDERTAPTPPPVTPAFARDADAEFAREIREAAKAYVDDGIVSFKGDADMVAVHRKDGVDLRHVATLLRQGHRREAAGAAANLDTLVRDVIPEGSWRYLQQVW